VLPVLLAGASALVWGAADFCGGVASLRGKASLRDRALIVAVLAHVCALPAIVPFLFWVPGRLTGPAMFWGGAAGLASLAGIVALNLGLASGAMATVAPVAAVTAALVPLAGGLLTGDRPAVAAVVGAFAAVGAIVLVSGAWPSRRLSPEGPARLAPAAVRAAGRKPAPGRKPELGSKPRPRMAGDRGLWRVSGPVKGPQGTMTPQVLVLALASGVAFGLFFLLLGRAGKEAGMWPLIADKAVSVGLGLAVLRACGAAGVSVSREVFVLGALAGSFDAIATALYLMSSHHGQVSIVAPIAALYPASTVVLALIFNKERLRLVQCAGLGLAGVALMLVAS
jgi:drug/metabolite transporter (DMT)-like permease